PCTADVLSLEKSAVAVADDWPRRETSARLPRLARVAAGRAGAAMDSVARSGAKLQLRPDESSTDASGAGSDRRRRASAYLELSSPVDGRMGEASSLQSDPCPVSRL